MDRESERKALEMEVKYCLAQRSCTKCDLYLTEECWFVRMAKEANNEDKATV